MVAHSIQMIYKRKARLFSVIIDAGDVDQVVKPEDLLRVPANFPDSLRGFERQTDFATKLNRFRKAVLKLGPELVGKIEWGHGSIKVERSRGNGWLRLHERCRDG